MTVSCHIHNMFISYVRILLISGTKVNKKSQYHEEKQEKFVFFMLKKKCKCHRPASVLKWRRINGFEPLNME